MWLCIEEGFLAWRSLRKERGHACPNCLFMVENRYIQLTEGGPEIKYLFLQEAISILIS